MIPLLKTIVICITVVMCLWIVTKGKSGNRKK